MEVNSTYLRKKDMKIAIYQCAGVPGSKDGNLKLLHNVALSAAEQGAQLLICPEMFAPPYTGVMLGLSLNCAKEIRSFVICIQSSLVGHITNPCVSLESKSIC